MKKDTEAGETAGKVTVEDIERVLAKEFEDPDDSSWRVYDNGEDGGCYDLSGYSDCGENIIVTVRGNTFAELAADAEETWEGFDPEEHASAILLLKRTGSDEQRRFYAAAPDGLRELLEDAESVKEMYRRVKDAFKAAAV